MRARPDAHRGACPRTTGLTPCWHPTSSTGQARRTPRQKLPRAVDIRFHSSCKGRRARQGIPGERRLPTGSETPSHRPGGHCGRACGSRRRRRFRGHPHGQLHAFAWRPDEHGTPQHRPLHRHLCRRLRPDTLIDGQRDSGRAAEQRDVDPAVRVRRECVRGHRVENQRDNWAPDEVGIRQCRGTLDSGGPGNCQVPEPATWRSGITSGYDRARTAP